MTGYGGRYLSSPGVQGNRNRKIVVQTSLGIEQGSMSKIANMKRVGGVAQLIECQPNQHRILSSIPSVSPKKDTTIYNEKYEVKGHYSRVK
jgi:hypothetical protein